jgi:hypothetical protein
VDAGSVLGLSTLWPTFLVHVSTAEPREGQAGLGDRIMIERDPLSPILTKALRVDDDDDDIDDEDDEEGDGDGDDEDEEGEGDDDEPETWQVAVRADSC